MRAIAACPRVKSAGSYVFRNSILTQVTALAMSLGGVFNGSIMTEIIFSYPGVGTLIQKAILQSDYNMILGCITISIVAICHRDADRRSDLSADRSAHPLQLRGKLI